MKPLKEREETFDLCGHSGFYVAADVPCFGVLSGFGWVHRHRAEAVISQKID